MKPEQFIREFGPNTLQNTQCHLSTLLSIWWFMKVKLILQMQSSLTMANVYFERDVVNRLIESLDLVKKLGGLQGANAYVPDGYKSDRLKQAIKDHEINIRRAG